MAALTVAAVLAAVVPGGAGADESATVKVMVRYTDPSGTRQPLAGVEVWLEEDYGERRFLCTNARGVARFEDVSSDVLHTAGVGPSFSTPRCANAGFVRPEDGRKMTAVVYDKHHGVLPLNSIVDPFYPAAGSVTEISMAARAVKMQKNVCAGLRATWVGTPGDDVYTGDGASEVLNGLGGDDVIDGGGGNDYICGGRGNDVLTGGKGSDVLLGEGGRDRLNGNLGYDIVDGGDGTRDWCRGERLFGCER